MKHSCHETYGSGTPTPAEPGDFVTRFEVAVMQVGREIGRRAHSEVDSELTGPQHFIMRLLCSTGGRKVGDMAETLGIQPSAVTAMVDRLEARGYALRERDAADRRVVWVRPTETGNEAFRKVELGVRAYVRGLLAVLDPGELETMVLAYEKMARAAAEGEIT